ncbi:hypothetical protein EV702DRAFT_1053337 [Suillus placidus]|uniref:Uncharacterized protein n=1 Tax=Suillus placidus TaxID=48579 RepID=A0A9P6ZFL0_9AGAM|nr:hypothetical protein EV702DRAFT_1053337 [Suillus placidus]
MNTIPCLLLFFFFASEAGKVCKFLRSAVDKSPSAQYAVELAASGIEDGTRSQLTAASRLALLKECNTCWDALKWRETRDLPPLGLDTIWEFCGGVFARSGLPGALRLHQLPSQYRNIQATSWRIPLYRIFASFSKTKQKLPHLEPPLDAEESSKIKQKCARIKQNQAKAPHLDLPLDGARIKQNQAKSEQGFDLGHKDKEYNSQDYDSKKSRKQAKDKDKDDYQVKDKKCDSQDYDKEVKDKKCDIIR